MDYEYPEVIETPPVLVNIISPALYPLGILGGTEEADNYAS